MPTCCVPGCTSGYRNDTSSSGRHFFSAPSDEKLRLAWNRAIPRADKDLTRKSRVCSLHFYDQDILKTYVHVINGETVEIPRGKWSLVDGALPKIFPNLPSYLTKPADKRRKRKRESNGSTNHGTASPQSEEASCSIIPADAVKDNMPEPCAPWFSEMECVELPPSWQRITVENSSGPQKADVATQCAVRMALKASQAAVNPRSTRTAGVQTTSMTSQLVDLGTVSWSRDLTTSSWW
ncbi:uncharacterized protein LOC125945856 [Dermacentor silvarum]|uniref:uncharacterized protein LOC125945856 n=1 Tax=Dermacentor silvarum TaxID=543639 RepID=UPI002101BEBA|nr:uncharacterized protein LOC125945856 [Dermacentor silvarum]